MYYIIILKKEARRHCDPNTSPNLNGVEYVWRKWDFGGGNFVPHYTLTHTGPGHLALVSSPAPRWVDTLDYQ